MGLPHTISGMGEDGARSTDRWISPHAAYKSAQAEWLKLFQSHGATNQSHASLVCVPSTQTSAASLFPAEPHLGYKGQEEEGLKIIEIFP